MYPEYKHKLSYTMRLYTKRFPIENHYKKKSVYTILIKHITYRQAYENFAKSFMLSFLYSSFETLNVLLVYSTHHESNDIECYLLSSLFKYTLKVQELILTADGLTDVMLRWVARLRIFLWSQSFLTGYRGFLGQIVWFTWL